jgi:NAD-reducing hydrogenase large subunit
MKRGLVQVAKRYLSGHEVSEGMLNRMEGLIRSFDPCLSCATHANGKKPLIVHIQNAGGDLVRTISRDGESSPLA